MRVMHLLESLEFGGAEKVVVDLANEMAPRHEVTICCVKRFGELVGSLDSRIRTVCLDKGEGNQLALPERIARTLRHQRIDVLHAHNWGVFLEGALAAYRARTPVAVHTVHGPYMTYAPGWGSTAKRAIRHRFERWLSRRYSKVVTVSDSIRQYVSDEIGIDSRRLLTIHNGVQAAPPTPRRDDCDPIVCMTVGRLAAVKNHAMMIRAFHQVADPRCRLWLVGDGPERMALEALSLQLGLHGRVLFTGFRQDIPALLATGHIFLMSSDYEGVSIAVLEAMRAALPVIGTRVGGMPETVLDGHTGMLIPAGDAGAMASAIRHLIESPEDRARMGENGRRFAETEFSLSTMVQRYEQIYEGEVV